MCRIKKFLALIFVMLVWISANSFAQSQVTYGSKEDPQKITIYIGAIEYSKKFETLKNRSGLY
jgi:hypothetical protein